MRCLVPILFSVVAASVTKRAAINRNNYPELLWPTDRPIPYKFSSDFSDEDRPGVKDVLNDIESNSCLIFKDVTNESDTSSTELAIVFQNNTNLDCHLQGIGKPSSVLSLAEQKCRTISVYYKLILRALGLFGPQRRSDRDDYISVYEDDIEPDAVRWYEKMSDLVSSTYEVPYDFDSLLHFTPDLNQKTEGIPTMLAKDPLHQPGMGINFGLPSHSDYLLLNRLYRCFDRCATSLVKCQNGGFLNPNECNECICPRGFAGRSCNELDYSCGGYETSTATWRRLSVDWSLIGGERLCFWFLMLENIVPEDPLCPQTGTWLEVRLGNFVVGGYKFFCNAHIPNHTLISEGNLTVIMLAKYADDPFEFELLFRNVEATSENTGSTFRVSLALMLYFLLLL
uniref:Metalloendopeptidase n=1 Tax=Steinernema glaseri TaxID=37863 RepID=A0A1I7YBZ7_9BILA